MWYHNILSQFHVIPDTCKISTVLKGPIVVGYSNVIKLKDSRLKYNIFVLSILYFKHPLNFPIIIDLHYNFLVSSSAIFISRARLSWHIAAYFTVNQITFIYKIGCLKLIATEPSNWSIIKLRDFPGHANLL